MSTTNRYKIAGHCRFDKPTAKNLIKFKLSNILDNITNDLLDNLFNSNPNNKYFNLMFSLDTYLKNFILDIIKECITIFDNLFLNSIDRKKYFNVSNKSIHRSIFTIFDLLEFDRIYYYDKHDKSKHFFFIDALFDFPSYDRYDKLIKAVAINNSFITNQKKGAEITNNKFNSILPSSNGYSFNISRQDIYNWINKWNVPNIEYQPIKSDKDTLYIMIDEKYIHEQLKSITSNSTDTSSSIDIKNDILSIVENLRNPYKTLLLPSPKEKCKHFITSKAFVTFTDIETKNNRRTLLNKFTFLTTSKNPWNEFMVTIATIYDFKKFNTIKVLSDAGTWITSGIPNLKLFINNVVVPCLCEFHVRQKVNRITKDEYLRKQLNNSIDNDDKEEFYKIINNILKDKSDKRKETIKGYKHYIIIHWDAIKQMKTSKYKSSMESHISHCIAKYFSYEPKAYSKRTIQKLIKLQEYQLNGINLIELYLKTSNNKEIMTLKKEELSFSMFEHKNDYSVPLLYSSSNFTSLALNVYYLNFNYSSAKNILHYLFHLKRHFIQSIFSLIIDSYYTPLFGEHKYSVSSINNHTSKRSIIIIHSIITYSNV